MASRPPFIRHHSELPDNGGTRWPWRGSDEVLGVRTPLSRPLGLVRLGIHHDVLAPGQRSSFPHAERFEEEAVYVLEGQPRARIDGEAHRLAPGDVCVFAPGTAVEHTIENDSEAPVRLLVVGERLDNAYRVSDALLAMWNARDVSRMDTLFDEDCRYEHVSGGHVMDGRTAMAAGFADIFGRFQEITMTRTGVVPSADRCALEWALEARTADGPVASRGVFVMSLHGERIRDLVHYDTVRR